MTRITDDPFRIRTETQTHGLGRTLRAVGIVTGFALGLVLLVGYPLVVVLGLALAGTLRTIWRRFGAEAVTERIGDGVTHAVRVPFTHLRLETTIRNDL